MADSEKVAADSQWVPTLTSLHEASAEGAAPNQRVTRRPEESRQLPAHTRWFDLTGSGHMPMLDDPPTAGHYAFTTLIPTPLQLDGEVLALDAGSPVRVDIAPHALATLG